MTKRKFITVTSLLTFIICSCNNNEPQKNNDGGLAELKAKLSSYDSLFNSPFFSDSSTFFKTGFTKVVNYKYAEVCLKAFDNLCLSGCPDCAEFQKAHTSSVGFNLLEIKKWITDYLLPKTNANKLQIKFGIYVDPKEYPNEYGIEEGELNGKIGRLTIFIFPYSNEQPAKEFIISSAGIKQQEGNPAEPLNFGDLKP